MSMEIVERKAEIGDKILVIESHLSVEKGDVFIVSHRNDYVGEQGAVYAYSDDRRAPVPRLVPARYAIRHGKYKVIVDGVEA
jgi:hypothetical protein